MDLPELVAVSRLVVTLRALSTLPIGLLLDPISVGDHANRRDHSYLKSLRRMATHPIGSPGLRSIGKYTGYLRSCDVLENKKRLNCSAN